MNRRLQFINLFGILLVAGLCAFQWNANRKLNLEINRLEKARIAQAAEISEQAKQIKGYTQDLDTFRDELTRTSSNLKEEREQNRSTEMLMQRLTNERDQLKTSVTNWVEAVAERDARLKEDSERITKLGSDLNASIRKYNELASNYNSVVEDLNALRSQIAPAKEGGK